jgi:hypothetical protein
MIMSAKESVRKDLEDLFDKSEDSRPHGEHAPQLATTMGS